MQIFPYILTRIGGGTFRNLTQLHPQKLAHCLNQLQELLATRERAKEEVCEALLAHIRGLADSKAQNQVQNLRRDIYNNRPLKPGVLSAVRQHLPASLGTALDNYLALLARIQALQQQAAAVYEQVVYAGRLQLQGLAADENLQKGLVLSSQSLLQAVQAYRHKDPADFRKKELQTEQSLLKYLTRMYTKTSPFSTFNSLAMGTLSTSSSQPIHTASPGNEKSNGVKGHIRLNNQLYRYLKDLFAANPEVYRHLLLRPNPTISNKTDHVVYLTNHHNVEAFQRIPANAVLNLLLELLQQHKAGIRFLALVQEACEYVDASAEAVEQYIRQLVSYGFIEYDLGVSGTDPDWDKKLTWELQYLEKRQVAHITGLIETLKLLRLLAGEYAQAPVTERQHILNQAFGQFRGICMKLHEAAGLPEIERKTLEELQLELQAKRQEAQRLHTHNSPENGQPVLVAEQEASIKTPGDQAAFEHKSSTFFHFKPEQLFYEDATSPVAMQYEEGKLKKLLTALSELLQELRLFGGMADEKEQMRQYFIQKYGPGSRISLLNFYEDYYRDIKKPEAERQARQRKEAPGKQQAGLVSDAPDSEFPEAEKTIRSAPVDSAVPLGWHHSKKRWMEQATAAFRNVHTGSTDQVEVSPELIRQLNTDMAFSEKSTASANSYGAFIQLYQEQDAGGVWQLKGVVNAAFAGYGKMISRFLHIFPEEVTTAVRAWNEEMQGPEELFIENADASYFNANLHPPLLPYEIRVPGGHTGLPVEKQIPITDLDVCQDEKGEELCLVHRPTAKRAYVFDLGFQGHGGRSPLFQLLDKFTKAEYLSVYPLISAINTASATAEHSVSAMPDEAQAKPKQMTVSPRIVYNQQIILQRKAWYVPKECIPQRQPDMPDWQYYMILNEWRKSCQIPAEVYVTIAPHRRQTGLDPEQLKKLGRDDYKPQYIHFTDPLLVHLFEKLLAKAPDVVKMEEMLPTSQQLTQVDGEPYVTESVVQWYSQRTNRE